MLAKKFLINGSPVPEFLDFQDVKPWNLPVVDMMENWGFGGNHDYVPMPLLLESLGLNSESESSSYLDSDKSIHDLGYDMEFASTVAGDHAQESIRQVMRIAMHLHNIEAVESENA